MTTQDELDALKIVVAALVKASPSAKATLCLEVTKGQEAALIQGRKELAAAFDRWLTALDCKGN